MRRFPHHSHGRGGFTLVELLVVITIIGILSALTLAGVIKALQYGDALKLRNEVTQLSQSIQSFKQQFAVGYVPDRVVLPPYYDAATQQYMKSVWPRLNAQTLSNSASPMTIGQAPYQVTYNRGVYDYWGVPSAVPNGQFVVLHGDQALVFWLGGPRDSAGNTLSFASDSTDPMNRLSPNRVTRFYDFPTDRLRLLTRQNFGDPAEVSGLPARAFGFPSFADVHGLTPYLYFATNRSDNSYVNPIAGPNPAFNPTLPSPYNLQFFLVNPYQLSSNRFANPSSFQIISGGRDQLLGQGGLLWAGATGGGATQQSYDDIGNFHPTQLGVPTN